MSLNKYRSLVLHNSNTIQFYFSLLVILLGLLVTFTFLIELSQIQIYRHDSAYYLSLREYAYKLKSEGRWLNYLMFPITSRVPGTVAIAFDLLFLFLFFFVILKRWTGNTSYSLLLSLLLIQVTPLTEALGWPAVPMSICLVLFLAALLSPHINLYLFYIAFGVLLFSTSSFYLLPLAHLHLFRDRELYANFKTLAIRIIPAWVLGFVIGFVFSLFMIYLLTDQVGIQIADWRKANYVRDIQDLFENTVKSFNYLNRSLTELFNGIWRNMFIFGAFLIGLYATKKQEYLPAAILAVCIILAHFVITTLSGIAFSFRSAFSVWIGVLAVCFFHPNVRQWQYLLMLPIIFFVMLTFQRVNHETLKYYASITNTYYNELLRATPLSPRLYEGLIFLSSSEEVKVMNNFLSTTLHLKRGAIETLDEDARWAPIAFEAGFKQVMFCKTWHKSFAACKSLYEIGELCRPNDIDGSGLYRIHGVHNGFLIISLNSDLDLLDYYRE